MPHSYTRTEQVKFLTEWFDSWSELQREDFLPIMTQTINPADHVNGLVGGVNALKVGQVTGERRPSLFDCQVKLFQDWYENWTPAEKERLLAHFKEADPEFAANLEKAVLAHQTQGTDITLIPEVVGQVSGQPPRIPPTIEDDSKDDGVSPGSHSSSPLSSLSQPLSPHDSGLEETHSDSEATPPPNGPSDSSSGGEGRDTENATPTPGNSGGGQEMEDEADTIKKDPTDVTTDIQEAI